MCSNRRPSCLQPLLHCPLHTARSSMPVRALVPLDVWARLANMLQQHSHCCSTLINRTSRVRRFCRQRKLQLRCAPNICSHLPIWQGRLRSVRFGHREGFAPAAAVLFFGASMWAAQSWSAQDLVPMRPVTFMAAAGSGDMQETSIQHRKCTERCS